MAAAETDGGGGAGTRLYTEDGPVEDGERFPTLITRHLYLIYTIFTVGNFNFLALSEELKFPIVCIIYIQILLLFLVCGVCMVNGWCCGLDCSIRFSVDQFPSEIILMFISLLHISHSDE